MTAIKAIFGILVIVGGLYLGFQLIPPYFNNYQFKDDIATEARFSSVTPNRSDDDIRAAVMKKVKEYNLPVTEQQVSVNRDQGGVTISVKYNVVVGLPGGRSVTMDFNPSSK